MGNEGTPPPVPEDEHTFDFTRVLRKNAPNYLTELTGISSRLKGIPPEKFVPATEGKASALYIAHGENGPMVVKFRPYGGKAEAAFLQTSRAHGITVPEVFEYGNVPSTRESEKPVQFLIMEAIVDQTGNPAQSGVVYATAHPESLSELGRYIGTELAGIHNIQTEQDLPYGTFKDMPATETGVTFAEFFGKKFAGEEQYFRSIGVTDEQLTAIRNAISLDAPTEYKTIVHGDCGPGNTLIRSSNPLVASYFDPYPTVQVAEWDLSHVSNRYELLRKYAEEHQGNPGLTHWLQLEQGYYEGFSDAYRGHVKRAIDSRLLLLNEIFRNRNVLRRKEKEVADNSTKTEPLSLARKNVLIPISETIRLRKNLILDQAEKLLRL